MRLNLESFFPILRNDISNKKYGYFFLLSVIIWFIEIFATYLMALALSIDVSIFIIFIVYFLIGFSMVLVLTPGNLGISEYIFVLILSLFNISPELSLALALVDRLVKSFTFFSLAFFSYNFIKSKDNIIASISDTKQSD